MILKIFKKWATKFIHICKNLSYKNWLILLELSTLKYRRLRGDMIEIFKILNWFYNADVVRIMIRVVVDILLSLRLIDVNETLENFHSVRAWNSLPDHVAISNSLNMLKIVLISIGSTNFMILKPVHLALSNLFTNIFVATYHYYWLTIHCLCYCLHVTCNDK